MLLLSFAFLLMAAITLGILLVAMKPSSEQKALDKRIVRIKVADGQTTGDSAGLLLLTPDLGAFGWLENIITSYKVSDKLQTLIVQSDVEITLGKLLFYSAACGTGFAATCFLFNLKLIVALVISLVACFYPVLFLRWRRNRRVNAFNNSLADSIDMMSRSLRAGHSVVAAVGIVAESAADPVKTEFNEVFKKQNYGLPLRDALMQMLDRIPSQDLRVLVTGMLVQKETGGNLAEILDRISFVIRERLRIQGEIRTHTAQGRLTGWILCSLPIVMLVLINWINPGYSSVLFNEPIGRKLLYLGVVLLFVGGMVIRQIINGIEV